LQELIHTRKQTRCGATHHSHASDTVPLLSCYFLFSCFIVLMSHFYPPIFSRKDDNSIGAGKGAVLLDLILKKPFPSPAAHIHSTHCNTRLFQYITSRNDTFLSTPSRSPSHCHLAISTHNYSFSHPTSSVSTSSNLQTRRTECRDHTAQGDIPAGSQMCCVYAYSYTLPNPPPPHHQPFLKGAFAKLRKVTINFVMSIHSFRPHGTTRLPLNEFSLNLIFKLFFENMSRKSKFH
jgi:hypothetical protein